MQRVVEQTSPMSSTAHSVAIMNALIQTEDIKDAACGDTNITNFVHGAERGGGKCIDPSGVYQHSNMWGNEHCKLFKLCRVYRK